MCIVPSIKLFDVSLSGSFCADTHRTALDCSLLEICMNKKNWSLGKFKIMEQH